MCVCLSISSYERLPAQIFFQHHISAGEISVDNELVKHSQQTAEEIFELNNGCLCCTVRGDLVRILTKLLRRKNKFDAVLIETTGLANPAPIAQTFWADDVLKEALQLDAILTVVDAKHILQHLNGANAKSEVLPGP